MHVVGQAIAEHSAHCRPRIRRLVCHGPCKVPQPYGEMDCEKPRVCGVRYSGHRLRCDPADVAADDEKGDDDAAMGEILVLGEHGV